MKVRLAALIVCLYTAGCGDDDAAPSSTRCDPGTSARCHDAGAREDAGASKDAGARHDAGIKHDAGARNDAGGADDDAGAQDAGNSPVSISFNLKAGRDCNYSASQSVVFTPVGLYDVLNQGTCHDHPYTAHLFVRSVWQNKMPGDQLHIDSATITLQTVDQPTIQFGTDQLPNPYTATTSVTFASASEVEQLGVAALRVIPGSYRPALAKFSDKQILAKIQLHGTTTSGEKIDATPFVYPIQICVHCLTFCNSTPNDMMQDRQDFVGAICDDNSGNDDRVCFDADC
jgi:hypothetical protein